LKGLKESTLCLISHTLLFMNLALMFKCFVPRRYGLHSDAQVALYLNSLTQPPTFPSIFVEKKLKEGQYEYHQITKNIFFLRNTLSKKAAPPDNQMVHVLVEAVMRGRGK
jgi:hypothetical protein